MERRPLPRDGVLSLEARSELLDQLRAATHAIEAARRLLAATELRLSQLWQVLRIEEEESSPEPESPRGPTGK